MDLMAKFVRMKDEKKAIDIAKTIVNESGAKEIILKKKGYMDIPHSKLRAYVASNVADALKTLADSRGVSPTEVETHHKNYIAISGRVGGVIREIYGMKA